MNLLVLSLGLDGDEAIMDCTLWIESGKDGRSMLKFPVFCSNVTLPNLRNGWTTRQ